MQSKLILGPDARPMARAGEVSPTHRAADQHSQELANWHVPLTSADGGWLGERDVVAARIHDIADNNGWVSGMMTRYLDHAIGGQFTLSARPHYRLLGMSFEQADEWSRDTEAKFWAWANDPRNYCDAAEQRNLAGLIGLGFRHRMADGEALAVARWIERPGFAYATAVQVIDPDRLSNPQGMYDDAYLRKGVEINDLGAAIAYHIRCVHPGDAMFGLGIGRGADLMRWERVAKYVPGAAQRRQVLHHFEPTRAGQTRGKPILTPVLEKTKTLDKYERTELQAAMVNAIFAAFITTPFDREETIEAFFGKEGAQNGTTYADSAAAFMAQSGNPSLGGVRIPVLYPGMKPEMLAATRPNQGFADFEKAVLRYIAAAAGQSYEELAQDWSSTNYSSARAAMLQSWKFLCGRRDSFAAGFATPIYVLWLEEAMDAGIVTRPAGAPEFWEAPAAWSRCVWRGTARGWVDPTKEAQASLMRMDAGVSSLQDEADEQGKDWEDVLEQQAREQQRRKALGLMETTWAVVSERDVSKQDDPDYDDREERRQTRRGA